MTTANAVNWFVTQPTASLTNALSRRYLLEILNDPAAALTAVIERQPLRLANARQINCLLAVTSSNTELLTRLPMDWCHSLERLYLAQVIAQVTPTDPTYEQVIASLPGLLIRYKGDDAASPAVNYGSTGSAINGTLTNATFQQAGPNAIIPFAYGYNGTTTTLVIPTSHAYESAEFTIGILVNPATIGEGSTGVFFDGLAFDGSANAQLFFRNSGTTITGSVRNTANANFQTPTSDGVTLGTWTWLFMQFVVATGRVHLFKSVAGVLTEFTYSGTPPALTGSSRTLGRGRVGTNTAGTGTTDGKISQFMLFGGVLTAPQMQSIITASGVT